MNPSTEPGIRVSRLTKRYGSFTALEDVSFSIRPGEVLGLLGPNGAGKTTLFECVAGVLPADHGEITAGARPLGARDRARQLFFVPDAIAPWPAETVRWALDFTIGFFGGRADIRDAVVDALGLAPFLHARLGTLSKGQRKRAVLAIGLLTPQRVLLSDEPFDGLDLRQTREVGLALRAHASGGRTLFLSIHQITDAARVCDRFVLLSGGRVCGEGTFDELAARAHRDGEPRPASLEEVVLALT